MLDAETSLPCRRQVQYDIEISSDDFYITTVFNMKIIFDILLYQREI
jgi:hypothetical protein